MGSEMCIRDRNTFVLVFRALVYSRQTANISKYESVFVLAVRCSCVYCVTPWRYCYRHRDGRNTLSAVVEESTLRQLAGPCIDCLRLREERVCHHESSAPGTASGHKFRWSFLRETAAGVPSVASLSYTSPFLRPAGRRVRVCPHSRRCVLIARRSRPAHCLLTWSPRLLAVV